MTTLKALLNPARKPVPGQADDAPGLGARVGLARFPAHPSALAGVLLLAAVALSAVFAGVLFPGDPLDMVAQPLLGPGRTPPSSWAATRSAATWPRDWRTARECRWPWARRRPASAWA